MEKAKRIVVRSFSKEFDKVKNDDERKRSRMGDSQVDDMEYLEEQLTKDGCRKLR